MLIVLYMNRFQAEHIIQVFNAAFAGASRIVDRTINWNTAGPGKARSVDVDKNTLLVIRVARGNITFGDQFRIVAKLLHRDMMFPCGHHKIMEYDRGRVRLHAM